MERSDRVARFVARGEPPLTVPVVARQYFLYS
jgi:hypothetical protein